MGFVSAGAPDLFGSRDQREKYAGIVERESRRRRRRSSVSFNRPTTDPPIRNTHLRSPATLLSLPAELLEKIFWYSTSPALPVTCKRLCNLLVPTPRLITGFLYDIMEPINDGHHETCVPSICERLTLALRYRFIETMDVKDIRNILIYVDNHLSDVEELLRMFLVPLPNATYAETHAQLPNRWITRPISVNTAKFIIDLGCILPVDFITNLDRCLYTALSAIPLNVPAFPIEAFSADTDINAFLKSFEITQQNYPNEYSAVPEYNLFWFWLARAYASVVFPLEPEAEIPTVSVSRTVFYLLKRHQEAFATFLIHTLKTFGLTLFFKDLYKYIEWNDIVEPDNPTVPLVSAIPYILSHEDLRPSSLEEVRQLQSLSDSAQIDKLIL
ncbi:hypothetical protein CANCADRAFT_127471 [Tortispora caseinolytica NRRL Y-17796]|uniref:Uncharacterized protein n=1 Tax=Tortispora caseinolytica NRRL Y-17796 TaxID=767744 RepID=A0A1E4TAF1_9ASCO|nr:hypothetical protein CANCADRAFT_127471 [Tortispora caseinolytica NRRL Y-17796]